jgi:hypothetical protein
MTEKVVIGLPLSMLWGNTLEEWVILTHNNFPSIVSEDWEWYPLQILNSGPHCLLEIQTTPLHGHPALVLALELILVVTLPIVEETVKTVIDEMTHGTDITLVNLLQAENVNVTHQDLITSIDDPENQWNTHLVSYDTLTCRVKPSSNNQLSYLVLATGPGNPPAAWVCTAKTCWFGSRPVLNRDLQTLGRPIPDTYPSTCGFCPVCLDPSVTISGSAFRVSHLWSHSNMLLLIIKY